MVPLPAPSFCSFVGLLCVPYNMCVLYNMCALQSYLPYSYTQHVFFCAIGVACAVLQSMDSKARQGLTPIKLRKKAAQFALKTVDKQREAFKVSHLSPGMELRLRHALVD